MVAAMHTQSTHQSYSQQSADDRETVLEIHYPLMQGARIKGQLRLTPFEVKGLERHKVIQEIFMRMAGKLSFAPISNATQAKGKEKVS